MKRFAIVLVLAACGGKSEEAPPSTGSAPAGSATEKPAGSAKPATGSGSAVAAGSGSGSAAPVAAAGSGAKDPELPTAEDFEEDSATKITEKNLETEVKALEKEIGEN